MASDAPRKAKKKKGGFTADDWYAEYGREGDVTERGYCLVCRTFWCPHAQPHLYGKGRRPVTAVAAAPVVEPLEFRRINDADWAWVLRAAKKRPEWSSHNPRVWGKDNELKGCIGELVYGRASGQDPSECLKYIPGGDHGYDYEPGVNVCGCSAPKLWVQEWRIEKGRERGVKYFALVVCATETRDIREAAYAGYASIDEVARAPINDRLPHPAHEIDAAALHKGFPSG